MSDLDGVVAIGFARRILRYELLTRNFGHGGQHAFVVDTPAAKLPVHHFVPLRSKIPNSATPDFIIAMMAHPVTLIPGDGIGPEVAEATVRAVDATGVAVEWERVEAGARALHDYGQLIPDDVFASLEVTRTGLKGPTATPIGGGHQSINVALRKKLGLYTNFRPVRMLPGLKTRFHDLPLDMAIFRENTEDLYSGLEHEIIPGVVESLKIITRKASMNIAHAAFAWARREGRPKITAIHKANIMKMSDGLFLKCCREVSAEFPTIQYNELIVDNACMQLVMRPETFDVLLLPNLYGDIISDLAAGLVGGLGIVPGANIGDHHAIFEAVHGTAPDIAGKGLANPTALMQSAVLMLAHLGEREASARLHNAIYQTYAERDHLTGDVGGQASTTEFTDAVIRHLG
jgi:isocitrate dehydrogenase (NAD+)